MSEVVSADAPSEGFLKTYRYTLAACMIVTVLCSLRYAVILLIFIVPPLAIWLVYSVIVAITRPARRKSQLIRAGIWLTAIFLILFVHLLRIYVVQAEGNRVAEAIQQYRGKAGVYPATLDDAGRNSEKLKQDWSIVYRRSKEGKPQLYIFSAVAPMDRYTFDFEKRTWVYSAE